MAQNIENPFPGPIEYTKPAKSGWDWVGQHTNDLLLTLGPATGALALGLTLHGEFSHASLYEGGVAALSALSALCEARGGKHKTMLMTAISVAAAATETLLSGCGPQGIAWGWGIGVAASVLVRLAFRKEIREARMSHALKVAEHKHKAAQTAFQHSRARHLDARTEGFLNPKVAVEDTIGQTITGTTEEERALRHAANAVFKGLELGPVDVQHDEYGYRAVITVPAVPGKKAFLARWGDIESELGLEKTFRLSSGPFGNQIVARYLTRDPLAAVVPYEAVSGGSCRDEIVLGLDEEGREVSVSLFDSHMLIAGGSGGGKSSLQTLLFLRLAGTVDAKLYGFDLKKTELVPVASLFESIATTLDEARTLFTHLEAEVERRKNLMSARGVKMWDLADGPELFVVVDELGELARQGNALTKEDKEAGEKKISLRVESALAVWRAMGVHMVLATQTPDKAVWGGTTSPSGNIDIRVSMKVNKRVHVQFVFEGDREWDPMKLVHKGSFMIQSPGNREPVQCRAQFADPSLSSEVARLSRGRMTARVVLPVDQSLSTGEQIVQLVARYGPMTRDELIKATGATSAAVHTAAKRLVERGQVTWDGTECALSGVEKEALSLFKSLD